jgi:hypothetical protein
MVSSGERTFLFAVAVVGERKEGAETREAKMPPVSRRRWPPPGEAFCAEGDEVLPPLLLTLLLDRFDPAGLRPFIGELPKDGDDMPSSAAKVAAADAISSAEALARRDDNCKAPRRLLDPPPPLLLSSSGPMPGSCSVALAPAKPCRRPGTGETVPLPLRLTPFSLLLRHERRVGVSLAEADAEADADAETEAEADAELAPKAMVMVWRRSSRASNLASLVSLIAFFS